LTKIPTAYLAKHQDQQNQLQEKLVEAQHRLPAVTIDHEDRVRISQVCSELDVDGLRGDIVTNRAAKALTAYEGRTEVTLNDIQRVIVLCLRHRLRKDPLEGIDSGYKVEKVFCRVFGIAEPDTEVANGRQPVGAR
jgi:magnesium chelatase subunit I